MSLRRVQLSAVGLVFFTFFFASFVALPASEAAIVNHTPTINTVVATTANWTFEGCWTQFSAGPCRDVYRDQQGNYWICRGCGTTGNPGPGKCNPISQATLASGFWCS
jgi:hypothetical protein